MTDIEKHVKDVVDSMLDFRESAHNKTENELKKFFNNEIIPKVQKICLEVGIEEANNFEYFIDALYEEIYEVITK